MIEIDLGRAVNGKKIVEIIEKSARELGCEVWIDKEYKLSPGSVNEVEKARYLHVRKIEPIKDATTRTLNMFRSEENPKKLAEGFYCFFHLDLNEEYTEVKANLESIERGLAGFYSVKAELSPSYKDYKRQRYERVKLPFKRLVENITDKLSSTPETV